MKTSKITEKVTFLQEKGMTIDQALKCIEIEGLIKKNLVFKSYAKKLEALFDPCASLVLSFIEQEKKRAEERKSRRIMPDNDELDFSNPTPKVGVIINWFPNASFWKEQKVDHKGKPFFNAIVTKVHDKQRVTLRAFEEDSSFIEIANCDHITVSNPESNFGYWTWQSQNTFNADRGIYAVGEL